MTFPKTAKALFLDRDGTIIYDRHYLSEPEKVELIPGVKQALEAALKQSYQLFLITNQSGIGRGYFTIEDAQACNKRMCELLGWAESRFTEIKIAPETADDEQVYRKPSPRFIIEMIDKHNLTSEDCFMIGDTLSDLQCGVNSGINSVAVKTGWPFTDETQAFILNNKIPVFDALPDFINTLLK